MKLLIRLLAGLCVLLLLLSGATVLWMITPYPMDRVPIDEVLQSEQSVRVNRGDFLVFEPAAGLGDAALIFYPGERSIPWPMHLCCVRTPARAGRLSLRQCR